jgi:polyprenyl-phospho-N-acetylgalactosaminyl synthase
MVYIIIPSFNEATVLKKTVGDLRDYNYHIVIVDDGSSDATENALKGLGTNYLKHQVNLGQGAALQTGIQYALQKGAAYLVTFDADGQHCAADIENALLFLKTNRLDVVFGSRFLVTSKTNVPLSKRMLLQLGRMVNFFATGVLLSDAHNGFRVFNRKAAAALKITEDGMSHATEILWQVKRGKLHFAEYPVTVVYTSYSRQKGQKLMHSFKVLQDILLHKIFR